MRDLASTKAPRRILWQNVSTVLSAAILIGAEVFGAAFAAGWAVANLTGIGDLIVELLQFFMSLFGSSRTLSSDLGVYILQGVFFFLGVAVMMSFLRNAKRVEPFTSGR